MKKFLPSTPALLIMSGIDRYGQAREMEIREALLEAADLSPDNGFLFSNLDTIVQRGWATRTKGIGGAGSDVFKLTIEGGRVLMRFHTAFNKLVAPGMIRREGLV
jgi:hypothetical protein